MFQSQKKLLYKSLSVLVSGFKCIYSRRLEPLAGVSSVPIAKAIDFLLSLAITSSRLSYQPAQSCYFFLLDSFIPLATVPLIPKLESLLCQLPFTVSGVHWTDYPQHSTLKFLLCQLPLTAIRLKPVFRHLYSLFPFPPSVVVWNRLYKPL